MSRPTTHQWRGVMEEYADWLNVPAGTPTVTLREGGTPLVVRRPPFGLIAVGAHDMGREYRVMKALADTAVRAPT